MNGPIVLRGPMVRWQGNPTTDGSDALVYDTDGVVVMADGLIQDVGTAQAILPRHPGARVLSRSDRLIVPGFVDTHLHLPQLGILGAYGHTLLDWLNAYTFPNEARFADFAVCAHEAEVFVAQLLGHGVTCASVFGSVHPASVDALFREGARLHMRLLAGKAMMDTNAPDDLRDTAAQSHDDCVALIDRWHGQGRLRYSITPRFAPTSTRDQLEVCRALLDRTDHLHVQSHLSESPAEVAWVAELFPENSHYLDVYEQYGLVGERAIHAHGIHLVDAEWERLAATNTALAHCPSSNLFLGSGLFDLARSQQEGVRVGLGCDIGAGTSLSPLRTMSEAYKVAQLRGHSVDAATLWWLHTAGAAQALALGDKVGNLAAGMEADVVVLDPAPTALAAHRLARVDDIHELLFFLAACGDDRSVDEVWVAGHRAWARRGALVEAGVASDPPVKI